MYKSSPSAFILWYLSGFTLKVHLHDNNVKIDFYISHKDNNILKTKISIHMNQKETLKMLLLYMPLYMPAQTNSSAHTVL